jgi:spore coat polysaccharide biosynthesis protein SpsF
MKIMAITQARYSSSRLPGKVLMPLGSGTVLDLHLKRIKKSEFINHFVVATTQEPQSGEIETIAQNNNFKCFHGSLDDVLDRFYQAAKDFKPEYVVRLTSDCPLIDSRYIDDLIKKFLDRNVDYAANCLKPTLPDGMDAEIFTFAALETAWKEATKKSDREHVTPFIRDCGNFEIYSVEYPLDLEKFRLTIDTQEDYVLIKKLVDEIGEDATTEEYSQCLIKNPEWLKINSKYKRNEGLKKSLQEDN